mmetsp:Transcript_4751/g.8131  ORF Transcript_4751/g.8131 Transcript_4751/m.8131 type:complete len:209 (-) Transcript_4751:1247-1873(-)
MVLAVAAKLGGPERHHWPQSLPQDLTAVQWIAPSCWRASEGTVYPGPLSEHLLRQPLPMSPGLGLSEPCPLPTSCCSPAKLGPPVAAELNCRPLALAAGLVSGRRPAANSLGSPGWTQMLLQGYHYQLLFPACLAYGSSALIFDDRQNVGRKPVLQGLELAVRLEFALAVQQESELWDWLPRSLAQPQAFSPALQTPLRPPATPACEL